MIAEKKARTRKRVFIGKIFAATGVLLLAFFLLMMAGCAAAPNQAVSEERDMVMPVSPAEKGGFAPAPSPPPVPELAASPVQDGPSRALAPPAAGDGGVTEGLNLADVPSPGTVGERLIIKNADLRLEILNVDEAVAEMQKLTDEAGGYVFSRQIFEISEDRRGGNVSLRVPADRFAQLLAGIKELGEVKNEHVYTDDVTMQFIDLEARITNLAAQEERLRELLDRAETVEDTMHVERELGRIRGELESLEGTFRHLRERIQFSAININLEERDVRTIVVEEDFAGFGERLTRLLVLNANRLLEGIASAVIVAIGSLPIVVPIIILILIAWKVVAVLVRRAINKKRARQQHLLRSQESGVRGQNEKTSENI